MPVVSRSWVAFAAVGAGLIHLALVIGAPPLVGVPLALVGLAEFGWGVLTFAREQLLVPRVAIVFGVVPVLLWAVVLAVAPDAAASLGLLPLAVASLFGLFVATILGRHLRRPDATTAPPGIARYLVGLLLGGLVVAALTAPALAATEAGGSTVSGDLFLPSHGH